MLVGAPAVLLSRFQSVVTAAAKLVFSANRSAHTTSLLQELHWLRVPGRIQFRLCVLTYRCLDQRHGAAVPARMHPSSIQPFLQDDSSALRHICSAGSVDMSHNDRRSRFSVGCSSGLELSAAASPGFFVDSLISERTENLPVFTIIFCCLTRHGNIVM